VEVLMSDISPLTSSASGSFYRLHDDASEQMGTPLCNLPEREQSACLGQALKHHAAQPEASKSTRRREFSKGWLGRTAGRSHRSFLPKACRSG
jgi:hypothetical protein